MKLVSLIHLKHLSLLIDKATLASIFLEMTFLFFPHYQETLVKIVKFQPTCIAIQ